MPQVRLNRFTFERLAADILAGGGLFQFEAHGHSMAPAVRDGDVLTLEPVRGADAHVGDIVLYRNDHDQPVVHRVAVRADRSGSVVLTIRGDAAPGAREAVPAERVLGRVVRIQRGGRAIGLHRPLLGGMARRGIRTAYLDYAWWGRAARAVARSAVGRVQRLRFYRRLAGSILGGSIRCRLATMADVGDLARIYGHSIFTQDDHPSAQDDHPFAENDRSTESSGPDTAGRRLVLVAQAGRRMAGAAMLIRPADQATYPDWWIFSMFVRPVFRGAGIGKDLVRLALDQAGAHGGERVHLLVFEENRPAVELYRKMGFRPSALPVLSRQLDERAAREGRRRVIMTRDCPR
ncbi:MAG: GNAT family N-acetyltransferase [Acidobacteria bacterium]|nr:GNAT family N-acetyltransferase [Acidobacteriota bacterium]